jgi:hypothetical protein
MFVLSSWLFCACALLNLWVWLQARRYEKQLTLLRDVNLAAAAACACGSALFLVLHFAEEDRERALERAWRAGWLRLVNDTEAAWARAHNASESASASASAHNATDYSPYNSTLATWLREMEYYALEPHGPTPP